MYSLLIVGAIVGIGFVSGKEIYSFFFVYKKLSFLMVVLCSLILFCTLNLMFKKCKKCKTSLKNNTKTSKMVDISNKNAENYFFKIDKMVLLVLSLLTLATMISGAVNLLTSLNINSVIVRFLFVCFLIIIVAIIIYFGGNILFKISSVFTLFLILAMLFILIYSCFADFNFVGDFEMLENLNFAYLSNAIFSVVFYVSMNSLSCCGVVQEIALKLKSKRQIFLVSFCASFIIFVLLFLSILVFHFHGEILDSSMPLLSLAKGLGSGVYFVYLFMLFSGCLVSTISVAFSCKLHLSFLNNSSSFFTCFLILVLGVLFSLLGFDFLVEKIYPLIGMIYLLWSIIKIFIRKIIA